jgi:hypothetical protein
MSNELIFIRDTIRQLKREYGSRLILGKMEVLNQNPETGRATTNTTEYKIPKAIRLPNQVSFDFLKSISNGKMGQLISGTLMILIDRSDIPSNFPIESVSTDFPAIGIDYGEFENQRLSIPKIEVYPYALIVFARVLPGRVGQRRNLSDVFGLNDGIVES